DTIVGGREPVAWDDPRGPCREWAGGPARAVFAGLAPDLRALSPSPGLRPPSPPQAGERDGVRGPGPSQRKPLSRVVILRGPSGGIQRGDDAPIVEAARAPGPPTIPHVAPAPRRPQRGGPEAIAGIGQEVAHAVA